MAVRAITRPLTSFAATGAVLILALLPGTASAGPASPPGSGGARFAGTHPAAAPSAVATGVVPTHRSCAAPTTPGVASCDALMRTDHTAHQGNLPLGVAPQGYGPVDLRSAYALPSTTAGAGATIAIVDAYDDPNAAADLSVYRARYGLPPCTVASGCFRKVDERGGHQYPVRDAGWSQEISLDLDMISAICPKCRILLVEADSSYLTDLGAAVDEAVALGAKYVSNSYGGNDGFSGEAQVDAQYYDHPGVVVTASGGDGGYPGGYPASSPHVVAVGGTSLVRSSSTPRGWSETAWAYGGSGCDTGYDPWFNKPAWQHDKGCANRTYDDVSAVADPSTGVAVYDSYGVPGWLVFGGTSVAAPLIAATYALAGTPVNGTYPASYPYANPSALNDVTSGSNGSGCYPAYVCTAGPGYDGPTGLGTPEGASAFAAGPHGTVTGVVRDGAGSPVAGALIQVGTAATYTNAAGQYTTSALTGSYTPIATKYGYRTTTGSAVTVTSNGSVTENLTLTKLATVTVSGTVTDASGQGWPLYAQIQVQGTPVVTYTNPVTGRYQLTLPAGQALTLDASAEYPGYQASQTSITTGVTGMRQDIGLTVDPSSCTAPGYQPVYRGYSQNFNSGTRPAGWSVSSPFTPGRWGWLFNNPHHRPNLTGGTGGFAEAEALNWNLNLGPPPVSLLVAPVADFSHDSLPVLQFKQDASLSSAANIQVEASVNGWLNFFDVYYSPQSVAGPNTVLIPMPQYAGQPHVQLRFAIQDAGSSWELDDVFIGNRDCRPVAGDGLIVGQVRDGNTAQPVNGATVTGGGQQAVAAPEPGDPAVGGGLYWLAAPAGAQTLTATAGGYSSAAARVSVTSGHVAKADFTLAAGRIQITPASASVTETMGGTRTTQVTIANTGSAPTTVNLTAQQGAVTVTGAAQRAGLAPTVWVRGHYSTAPMAGLRRGSRAAREAIAASSGWSPPWTSVAHYPEFIMDNAAATDPVTGDVYSVAGLDVNPVADLTGDAFVYHPATGSWSQLPALPFRLDSPMATVIAGKLYVTGGYDGSAMQASMSIYDPHTGQWSPGTPIPQPVYGAASATLDGKMYVIGGCAVNGQCTSQQVQVYDPVTRTWSQAAPYPRQISFLYCGAISGKLYCAGGFDHTLQTGTTAAYVYDLATNHWTPIANLPIDLWGGAGAAANGQLLASGGITRFNSELTNQGYAFDPTANRWSPLPNAPDPVYRGAAACGFYTIGGVDVNGLVAATAQLPGYGRCDGGSGVPWLTEGPSTLTLAPGKSATVKLIFTASAAAVPQPGTYSATLTANSGAPYPAPQIPVTLTATPPANWAGVSGVVSGKACDGRVAPVDAATVQVGNGANGQLLTTGPDGKYVVWLPAKNGPLPVIATASTWLTGVATAQLKTGAMTTVNFTLKQASCG